MHAFGFPPPINMQRDLERGGGSFWREGTDGPIAEEVEIHAYTQSSIGVLLERG